MARNHSITSATDAAYLQFHRPKKKGNAFIHTKNAVDMMGGSIKHKVINPVALLERSSFARCGSVPQARLSLEVGCMRRE
jgi:hypothetical protein